MTTARSKTSRANRNRVALRPVVRHYVVTAYRWGMRDAHSYVVGCYDTKREANKAARLHLDYRGGQYGIEVIECNRKMNGENGENAGKQVGYVESPYHGMGNQKRPAMQPAKQGKWLEKLNVPNE